MATTVNNTTANSRITIIYDAKGTLDGDGPRLGTGNTESDVYIDSRVYYNVRSHTEIDANIHAIQWNAATNTGEIEFIDNRENESISSFPTWASNVVIRCEAQDVWESSYNSTHASTYAAHPDANLEDDSAARSAAESAAKSAADTARVNYLSAHSITY